MRGQRSGPTPCRRAPSRGASCPESSSHPGAVSGKCSATRRPRVKNGKDRIGVRIAPFRLHPQFHTQTAERRVVPFLGLAAPFAIRRARSRRADCPRDVCGHCRNRRCRRIGSIFRKAISLWVKLAQRPGPRAPSRSTRSRCPGHRHCCCRPGNGRSRRPANSIGTSLAQH